MCSHLSPSLGEVPELAAPLSPPKGGGVGFMGLISLMGLIVTQEGEEVIIHYSLFIIH